MRESRTLLSKEIEELSNFNLNTGICFELKKFITDHACDITNWMVRDIGDLRLSKNLYDKIM